MSNDAQNSATTVTTVLGPIPADELGVIAVSEALLSVLPGAEHAHDISMDRSQIFAEAASALNAFREAGGSTVVDTTGMFHGRDVPLLEALSRSTGVTIVASTGMGPEELLGGYFLTPQTNPPTPWPAEKFADLFTKEIAEGMVVPRIERRGPAGLVVTAAATEGMTPTEESLFRGAARTALSTGAPVIARFGADPVADLDVLLDEGLSAERAVIAGLDRSEVDRAAIVRALDRGAFVLLDHVGSNGDGWLTDGARADLVSGLIADGHGERILLSASATGAARGVPANDIGFGFVLTDFLPMLTSRGVSDAAARGLVTANPRALLTRR
ncbi:phosphotriesterase [Brevibacterium marinum]|uniref:Phosphotriesterase-related protein n=1 Tax=Brevibacterium marinum TaxID=418643 RepID=A0A846RYD4_9MICO|nr:phosphotriesterase [Brevibacterium marinum]NJC55001.1 phosphotriesterase-related protein [Brevibacterium marinum]